MNYLTYHEYLCEFLEDDEICENNDTINNARSKFGYLDNQSKNGIKENIKKTSLNILEVLFTEYITIPTLQKEVAYLILVASRLISGFKEGEKYNIRKKYKIEISNKKRFEDSLNYILNEFGYGQTQSMPSIQYQSTGTNRTNETGFIDKFPKIYSTPTTGQYDSAGVHYMNVKPNVESSIASEYQLNLQPNAFKEISETAPSSGNVVRNLSKEKNYTPSSKLEEGDKEIRRFDPKNSLKTLVKKKEDCFEETLRKEVSFQKNDSSFMRKSNCIVLDDKHELEASNPVLREKELRSENENNMAEGYISRNRYRNRQSIQRGEKENIEKPLKASMLEQSSYVSLADEYKRLKQKSVHKGENSKEKEKVNKLSLSGLENVVIENQKREMRTSNYYQPPKMRYSRSRSPHIEGQPGWQTDRYNNRGKRSPVYYGYQQHKERSVEKQQPLTDRSTYYNNKSYLQFQNTNNNGNYPNNKIQSPVNYDYNPRISNSSFLPRERDYASRNSKYREGSLTQRSRRVSNMNEHYFSPSMMMTEDNRTSKDKYKKVSVPLLKLNPSRVESRINEERTPPLGYKGRVNTSRDRRGSSIDRGFFEGIGDYQRAAMTDRGRIRKESGDYIKLEGIEDMNRGRFFQKKVEAQRDYFSPSSYQNNNNNYRSNGTSYRTIERINKDIDMRYSNYYQQNSNGGRQVSPSPIERHRMMRKDYKREREQRMSNSFLYQKDRRGSVSNRNDRSPYGDFEKVYTPSYMKKIYGDGSGGRKYCDFEGGKENYGDHYNYYNR